MNKRIIIISIMVAIILIIIVGLITTFNKWFLNINTESYTKENQDTAKLQLTDLEKYILGANGTGRNLEEICKDSSHYDSETNNYIIEWNFIDDETTEINEAEKVTHEIHTGYDHYGDSETGYYMERYFYIKYEDNLYRFKTVYNSEITDNIYLYSTTGREVTVPINKNERIKKIEVPEGKHIGEEVTFNGIEYIVLYGEGEKEQGVQLITKNAMDNGDNFYNYIYLGSRDPMLDNLPEGTITALEKNKTIGTENEILDLEKALYSYNHAVSTLNSTCEKIIKTGMNDKDKNKIVNVRSVGSNPNSNDTIIREDGVLQYYSSTDFAQWPINDKYYEAGIVNGKVENRDINYLEDYDRLVAIGKVSANNWYWLASRTISVRSKKYLFRRTSCS